MLTFIALSAVLMQEPPTPPAPPESRVRVMMIDSDGPGTLDKDGDGQITRDEFAAPMNDHFARMDKNGDGRLSSDEMTAGHGPEGHGEVSIHRRGAHGGPGAHRFEMRHPEGAPGENRTVVFLSEPGPRGERGEHEVILRGPGAHGGPHIIHLPGHDGPGPDARFDVRVLGGPDGGHGHGEMDKDGDGKVSEAEFTGPLRDAFARMDADRSGFIEEGEHGGDGDVRVFTHRIETRRGGED